MESSDESMPEETASQRLSRYQNRDQCEVSETDEWAVIHCGLAGDERDETELTKENRNSESENRKISDGTT